MLSERRERINLGGGSLSSLYVSASRYTFSFLGVATPRANSALPIQTGNYYVPEIGWPRWIGNGEA